MNTKTLIVNTSGRVYRVKIPTDAKVTFGPLVPASGKSNKWNGGGDNDSGGTALRIYHGKDNQMAVFRNVVSFYDTSLPIDELVIEINGKTEFASGKNHESNKSEKNRTEKWMKLLV